jgi:type IV pilus assembly protein PilE
MKRQFGFTLIELMIVVLVISVLAGLALSAYGKQVRKARRAEAKHVLTDLILREEKWRSNHIAYGDCDEVMAPSSCAALNNGTNVKYYNIALTAGSYTATIYTFTAVPKPGSDQANDPCGTLTIEMINGTLNKSPTTAGCWQ